MFYREAKEEINQVKSNWEDEFQRIGECIDSQFYSSNLPNICFSGIRLNLKENF